MQITSDHCPNGYTSLQSLKVFFIFLLAKWSLILRTNSAHAVAPAKKELVLCLFNQEFQDQRKTDQVQLRVLLRILEGNDLQGPFDRMTDFTKETDTKYPQREREWDIYPHQGFHKILPKPYFFTQSQGSWQNCVVRFGVSSKEGTCVLMSSGIKGKQMHKLTFEVIQLVHPCTGQLRVESSSSFASGHNISVFLGIIKPITFPRDPWGWTGSYQRFKGGDPKCVQMVDRESSPWHSCLRRSWVALETRLGLTACILSEFLGWLCRDPWSDHKNKRECLCCR